MIGFTTIVTQPDCMFTNQQTLECNLTMGTAALLVYGLIGLVAILGVIGIVRSHSPGKNRRQRGVEPGQGSTLHHHGGFAGNSSSYGAHSKSWVTSNDPQKHAKAMMPK